MTTEHFLKLEMELFEIQKHLKYYNIYLLNWKDRDYNRYRNFHLHFVVFPECIMDFFMIWFHTKPKSRPLFD